MKSRGGLGREVGVPSLTSPPPSLLFFRAPFYFAPLPLSERLEQASDQGLEVPTSKLAYPV